MRTTIFSQDEIVCAKKFDGLCKAETELFKKLFDQLENFVQQISGKVKDIDRPRYTTDILLVYNLTLFSSSFNELRTGYLGVSQSILRSITENLTLSMYYFEFPDHELQYRDNPRELWKVGLPDLGYRQGWMDSALARIDAEGKTFNIFDGGGESSWQKLISKNLMEEASSLLHQNFDYIESLVYQSTQGEKNFFVYSANWKNDEVMKNGLWKIIEAMIFETAIFDSIFKDLIAKNDRLLVKEAVEKLNAWKREYSSLGKL